MIGFITQKHLTKRAPDAGDSAHIPSNFTRLSIFLAGRLRRPHPSAGNANRWALVLHNLVMKLQRKGIPMKKHLHFLINGALIGALPGFLILIWRASGNGVGIGASQLISTIGISLIIGGVPGAIGGWIGGSIVKKNWGAVVGGVLGSIYWALAAATMM